jgi:methyl-accepting chemotaxis protein
MTLNRFRIGTRLSAGFAAVLLLLALMLAVGLLELRATTAQLQSMMRVEMAKERLSEQWLVSTRVGTTRAMAIARIEDPKVVAALTAEAKAAVAAINLLQQQLKQLGITEADQALLDTIGAARKLSGSLRDKLSTAKAAGRLEDAARIYDEEFMPSALKYAKTIEDFRDHQRAMLDQAARTMADKAATAQKQLAGLGLTALLLGTLLAGMLRRSITRPLAQAVVLAEAVAAGDLTRTSRPEGRDEIASLLRSLDTMSQRLHGMVTQVRQATDSIHTASSEVAVGNQDLSQRTEQTASSLQQAAASMEQLNSTVQKSSSSARQASELAGSAAEVAQRGGAVVQRVVATMSEISASSHRITDIIATIDGIAFQTNILALNAAVEAARAGEQGRGFAVVASEVRSLAQRSAAAAREIKGLIVDSVERVEGGSRLVTDAGGTMTELERAVQRVAAVIGEITDTTLEQGKGIAEVSVSVNELDRMTQQNSALVEQSAAAAESLKAQAAQLTEAVSSFRL